MESVPIFVVWVLTMLPAVMAVDAVLRVYAQTRFLLIMNLVRFACVAGLIGAFLSSFGLIGAVLVALVGADGDQDNRRHPHRLADAARRPRCAALAAAGRASPPSQCCRPSRSRWLANHRLVASCHLRRGVCSTRRGARSVSAAHVSEPERDLLGSSELRRLPGLLPRRVLGLSHLDDSPDS